MWLITLHIIFYPIQANHLKNEHTDFHELLVLISVPQLTLIVCLTAAGDISCTGIMRFQSYEVFGY